MSDYRAAIDSDQAGESGRRSDGVVLLTTSAMCARRHPWALVGLWAWQGAVALSASWPAAALVRASYGGDPRGDAVLWDAGGHALLDWLWHEVHGTAVETRAAMLALAVAAVVGLVPLGALMFSMTYATRQGRPVGLVRSVAGGLRAFKAFAVLLVVAGLVQAAVVGIGAGAATLAQLWSRSSGEARAEQIEGVIVLVFLAAASGIGVVHDLARAAVVRFNVGGLRGLMLGARTFRLSPWPLWWSWAWRAAAGAAPVVVAAGVAGRLGGRGGFALVFLAFLHQAVVLSRIALRASWLGRALRAVDTTLRRVG